MKAGGESLISLYLNEEGTSGDAARTLSYGRSYLLCMLAGLIPYALAQVYSSTLREAGETVLPMKAGIAAVLVNLVLNYILIYGKFGAPALGVVGAAIATVISRYVECLIVALCWVPILSWAVLFGGAGVMIWNAFTNNEEGSENKLVEFVKDRNIAVWMRKLVGEANLESKVKEAKISESIREAFMENENQEKIVADIVESLNAQVQSKMDDIKYVIESR